MQTILVYIYLLDLCHDVADKKLVYYTIFIFCKCQCISYDENGS